MLEIYVFRKEVEKRAKETTIVYYSCRFYLMVSDLPITVWFGIINITHKYAFVREI